MKINYLIPRSENIFPNIGRPESTDKNGKIIFNKRAFDEARNKRIACYTYYKKTINFSLFKKVSSVFSNNAKLAQQMYASYERLLQEDTATVSNHELRYAKNAFLYFCYKASALRKLLTIKILEYFQNKVSKKGQLNALFLKYKSYLTRLEKKYNDRLKDKTYTKKQKTHYREQIKQIQQAKKLDNPLEHEFTSKTKESKYMKQLQQLNDTQRQERLQEETSFLGKNFHKYMNMMTGALVSLNKILTEKAGLEPTIIEPIQWLTRDIEGIKLTDDDKVMLLSSDQDNYKKLLFGEDAPTDITSLIESLSDSRSIRSLSRESMSSINDMSNPDDDMGDITLSGYLSYGEPDSDSDILRELQELALENDSSEFSEFSDTGLTDSSDNIEPLSTSGSDDLFSTNAEEISRLDDAMEESLKNSAPFTNPTVSVRDRVAAIEARTRSEEGEEGEETGTGESEETGTRESEETGTEEREETGETEETGEI